MGKQCWQLVLVNCLEKDTDILAPGIFNSIAEHILLASFVRVTETTTMTPSKTILAAILLGSACHAFIGSTETHRSSAVLARRRKHEEEPTPRTEIPQLPAFGATSRGLRTMDLDTPAVVNRKFQLSYTCNRCETRNSHMISRQAYQKGVVIGRCQGCDSQHLLADHLDWTNMYSGNIEDYLEERQEKAHRVSPEVYGLENVLAVDTKGGSIRDEQGNIHLE